MTKQEFVQNYLVKACNDCGLQIDDETCTLCKYHPDSIHEFIIDLEQLNWKPYPKIKPETDGYYLVTVLTTSGNLVSVSADFENGDFCSIEMMWDTGNKIIGWMDVPSPMRKKS